MPVDHWMMFGTFGEQRYFTYPSKDTYQGVIINCNMAVHAPDGIASFVLTKTYDQRYILDPQTHAFQHDPTHVTDGDGNLRASIDKLADAYGGLIREHAGRRPLLPGMLSGAQVRTELVKNCLAFQLEQIPDKMRASGDAKYLDFEVGKEPILEPYALVAPYFYMQQTTVDEWLPINLEAVRIAVELYPGERVFASVVVSQALAEDTTRRAAIINAFAKTAVAGVLIWVDDLDETVAGTAELRGLLKLAKGLRKGPNGPREVINLHGGYFSVLASREDMAGEAFTGVCHGPEFGEHRSVVPVGGGVPIARYYVPALHKRVRYREAAAYFQAKGYLSDAGVFHTNVCDCAACKDTLGGDAANFARFGDSSVRLVQFPTGLQRREYPTGETKIRCLEHYLEQKRIEYGFAATASRDQVLKDLEAGKLAYQPVAGLDGVAHLDVWKNVLAPPAR